MVQLVKNPPAMQETWVRSPGQDDPLEKEMATHSRYSCLENPHVQRILAGYSAYCHKEFDTTEQLNRTDE